VNKVESIKEHGLAAKGLSQRRHTSVTPRGERLDDRRKYKISRKLILPCARLGTEQVVSFASLTESEGNRAKMTRGEKSGLTRSVKEFLHIKG